jgi:RNA polymerase sigma-70 factor (ECF subfamily)
LRRKSSYDATALKNANINPQAIMDASAETTDDTDLLQAWRNGNMSAFDRLYQHYRQPLFLFLLRRGHQQAEAEEIFHDCWMRVIHHQEGFSGVHFKAWLYTIARNLSTDSMRKHRPEQLDESGPGSEAVDVFSAQRVQESLDCVELMKDSVAALPIEQRDVFLLQHEAGLTLQQIAELMAVGRETIKSRIRYAMKQLRQLMADCL